MLGRIPSMKGNFWRFPSHIPRASLSKCGTQCKT